MTREINLLIPRKQAVQLNKAKRYLSILVGLLLTIFIITTLALVGINMLIISTAKALTAQVERAKSTIEQKRSVESLHLVLVEKLTQAEKIINARLDYPKIIDAVIAIVPNGVTIESLRISKEGTISIQGAADSVPDLDRFINLLLSAEQFSSYVVRLSSAERHEDGSYTISLEIIPQKHQGQRQLKNNEMKDSETVGEMGVNGME